jgi:NhaP-type Na+/H+ or K+/H+ antiporter
MHRNMLRKTIEVSLFLCMLFSYISKKRNVIDIFIYFLLLVFDIIEAFNKITAVMNYNSSFFSVSYKKKDISISCVVFFYNDNV